MRLRTLLGDHPGTAALKSGAIKSFVRKTHPWNKSGTRLVSRSSIDEYLRRQALAQGALPDNGEVAQ